MMRRPGWTIRRTGNVAKDNGDGTCSVHVTEGKSISEPELPSRSGYTFEGWYTEPSGGTKWDFAGDTAAGHLTLYAQWRSTTRYTVIAKAGEGGSISPSGSTTVYAGEDAVFTVMADGGYSLADVLPQTGDGSNPGIWFGMLALAALGFCFLAAGRKKRGRAS